MVIEAGHAAIRAGRAGARSVGGDGLDYLPAIARRLHHCRDLSEAEPFDFLTWFEFAKADTAEFDKLLARLRASVEWQYVEREVEIRLIRTETSAPN